MKKYNINYFNLKARGRIRQLQRRISILEFKTTFENGFSFQSAFSKLFSTIPPQTSKPQTVEIEKKKLKIMFFGTDEFALGTFLKFYFSFKFYLKVTGH